MDRPSQDPPDPSAAESPLSFPVEAPRLSGVEPGGGAPPDFPVEAPRPASLEFPAEVARPGGGEPLSYPVEAALPGPTYPAEVAPPAPLDFPVEAPRPEPLAFPAEAAQPTPPTFAAGATQAAPSAFPPPPQGAEPPQQLPFPVAEIPGVVAVPQPVAANPEPPVTPGEPAPSGLLRLVPPLLAAAAALMAALGVFLPLFRVEQRMGRGQRFFQAPLTVTETAWGTRTDFPGQEAIDQGGPPVGIPLIAAVVLLVVAAVLAFSRPDRPLGRWLLAAGAFFTAGVVFTVGMSGLGWSAIADAAEFEVSTAAGMWLLIGATVLAAAAAVVAALLVKNRGWADPALAYSDTPTPPSGVAITVLPPDEPPLP
ncbi:hypothetical protein [Amycolatopsis nalaikhensis]|uniref:Uncharacterized protein n=1 Tax=Amycolatopsis nalaikhensis TaxID=715472 RepID=A0ABY8XTJ5_9PSEU|nr:hypothetical protein [Amycolatopsis sp. 2-2]WIV58765.1 hypothetical protein QP939_09110 [Amycolatopsis sp. 2-2]